MALADPTGNATAEPRLHSSSQEPGQKAARVPSVWHRLCRAWQSSLLQLATDKYPCCQVEDLGLSAVPHVSPVESFDPSRQMLVLVASDGVWDVASAERVVQACPQLDGLMSSSTCHRCGYLAWCAACCAYTTCL